MPICLAYFDASGSATNPNERVLCLGGFITTESRWQKFETKWEAILKSEGLTSFHMEDFAHFKNEFRQGWQENEPRRRKLIQDLTRVTKRYVRRAFSKSLDLDEYDAVDAEYEFHEHAARPYGLLAGAMMSNVQRWLKAHHPHDQLLFAFEKGDTHQSELLTLIEEDKRFALEPQFLRKKWKENNEWLYRRPFEACDLLAYEHRGVLPLVNTGKKLRGSAHHLGLHIPGADQGGGYNRKSLLGICSRLNIPKRKRT